MATVAIGDIHGNFRALEDLVDKVLPDLGKTDTLVFLGDYIDRGPETKRCIDSIISLRSKSAFSVVTLMGNHEEWLLATMHDYTRHSWLIGAESFETIESYSREAATQLRRKAEDAGPRLIMETVTLPYSLVFDAMPRSHVEFFESLEPYHRSDGVICVHAGLDSDDALEAKDTRIFTWGPDGFPEQYSGKEMVVYGHKNNYEVDHSGWPKPRIHQERTFGINTISTGVLTALRKSIKARDFSKSLTENCHITHTWPLIRGNG
jgi:serine/threonine protein phosphatase 1